MIRFPFNEDKAREALVFVAKEWPGITAFYASKVFFIADRNHLNTYGRPVIGDRYIAMKNGPVPSGIYDWFKGSLDMTGDPEAILHAINFEREHGTYIQAKALREPDMDMLSPSDVRMLREAIEFCKQHSVGELSSLTHNDRAWAEAELNAEMDPALMIDESDRKCAILQMAEEFAHYGVA